MKRERLHLTNHAKNESIPLRIGKVWVSEKIYIENIVEDQEGTGNQTISQRSAGNIHLLVDLWTDSSEGEYIGRWRIVVGKGAKSYHDRSAITVLQQDKNEIRTENSLTNRLKEAIPENSWISPEYIVANWHPLYKAKQLRNSEDLNKLINQFNMAPMKQELYELKASKEQQESYIKELEVAVRMNKLADQKFDGEIIGVANKITDTWQSKTGSAYLNFGIEAYVAKVNRNGDQIELTYVNEMGKEVTINDFGYNGFVGHIFDYLNSKLSSRAIFIITHKPNGTLKLASDTMLLSAYKNLWAK